MLAEGRDLLAVIRFEKLLSQERERLAQRVVAGETLRPEHLAAAEAEAYVALKKEFFNATARNAVKPESAAISDEEDFAGRGQRLMEQAVLMAHRGLLAIPVVGDPSFSEGEGSS